MITLSHLRSLSPNQPVLLFLFVLQMLFITEANSRISRISDDPLLVDIEPVQKQFKVNEKIRLHTFGNQSYYLYLFNVDPKTQEALMILPNHLQQDNYYAQNRYIVPNRNVEFYSDRPGIENMIMVASKTPLPVNLDHYKSIGDFVTGPSATFEKALGVRFHNQPTPTDYPDIIVKTFTLEISEAAPLPPAPPAAVQEPITFISTAFRDYNEGERFTVVFGANQAGYLHLYSIDPSGAYDLLKVVPTDGKTIHNLTLQAAPPFGVHTLMALYSSQVQRTSQLLESLSINPDKSLSIVEQPKRSIASHQITLHNAP